MKPKCPWCQSDRVEAEFVDIGVGNEQVSPYECYDCGAVQVSPGQDVEADDEELRRGWYRGYDDRDSLAQAAPRTERIECRNCINSKALVKAGQKRLKDQEQRFNDVKEEFQRVAGEVSKTNGQMRRTIANLQQELGDARGEALRFGTARLLEDERIAHANELAQVRAEHERLVVKLREDLEKALGKPTAKDDGKTDRFSLLEVD